LQITGFRQRLRRHGFDKRAKRTVESLPARHFQVVNALGQLNRGRFRVHRLSLGSEPNVYRKNARNRLGYGFNIWGWSHGLPTAIDWSQS